MSLLGVMSCGVLARMCRGGASLRLTGAARQGGGLVDAEQSPGSCDAVVPVGVGRESAVTRLLTLDGRGELRTAHVRLVASALNVSERTVWNWLSVARREGRTGPCPRPRFTVTREIRELLALWGGNVSAVHRELVARAAKAPSPDRVPSLSVLHR